MLLLSYTPLEGARAAFSKISATDLLILVTLSLAYYLLKTVRFWYLLQALQINKSYPLVALSYMAAQPVTLLPGGELYRSQSLKLYTGVPIKRSLAQFTMQGILEGAGLASVAVVSALALQTLRTPLLIFLAIVVLSLLAINRGYLAKVSYLLNRLPFITITPLNIEQFNQRNKNVLTRRWLPALYGLSILIELIGASVAMFAVSSTD